MLSLLLLLTAAPQATIPEMPRALVPPPPLVAQPDPPGSIPILGRPLFGCSSAPTLTITPRRSSPNALQRTFSPGAGEPVALYRLLERRVGGCPAPIVVIDRVPGSNAIGRELGHR